MVREGVVVEEGSLGVSDESDFLVGFLSDVGGARDTLFGAEVTPEEGVVTGAPVDGVVFEGARVPA